MVYNNYLVGEGLCALPHYNKFRGENLKQKNSIKFLAVIFSVLAVLSSFSLGGGVFADETTTAPQTETTTSAEQAKEEAQKKLEEQKRLIEENLKQAEEKLAVLAVQSKDTEEYINLLDEKIGYLNEELTLLDNQVIAYEEDIDALQKNIDLNQADADVLQAEVDKVQSKLDELNERFQAKYDAYCARARAIYISGNFNIITALLTCDDISSFLTRYEMIKAVSKSDAELLEAINEETAQILIQESDLSQKKTALDDIKAKLTAQRDELVAKQTSLTYAQQEIARKKIILSDDKAESDRLFAELTAKNGMYTEFMNEDKSVIDAVEAEIMGVINGLIKPEDVTLGTTSDRDNYTMPEYNFNELYNNSDGVLNMTYPIPGYYTISAGFPNYNNGKYHGGIDFPCPKGSDVVAAQNGIVIKVERLNYSYGYYVMIYHGTDSKGRSVVTLYGHNSQLLVSPGQSVSKGQQIAKSGSTGNSTGPHCHFEVRFNGERVNPKNYLSK